jgi:hypothetical protein
MIRTVVDPHRAVCREVGAFEEILLAQRQVVESHPRVLHQAGILCRQHRVTIVDPSGTSATQQLSNASVARHGIASEKWAGVHPLLARVCRDRGYRRQLVTLLEAEPDVAVALEPRAGFAAANGPKVIAAPINGYLLRSEQRREVAARARTLHLREYNYEAQFAPVAEWVARPRASRLHA